MKIVKNTTLLNKLIDENHIADLFSNFEQYRPYFSLVELHRRSILLTEYEYANYLIFFVKGTFKVYGNLENGKRILFRFCHAFMMLGEMEFLGHMDISTSVEAVENCLCVALDYRPIREQLQNDPVFLHHLCKVFAEKLAYFGTLQLHNVLQSAEEKVAVYLLNMTESSPTFKENLRIVAEELNLSYRHLHRVLRLFKEQGIIAPIDGGFKICDREQLTMYSLRED